MTYNKDYLDVYKSSGSGYDKVATDVVDFILAVRTPLASANKFKKRQGAKAIKKLEQLESVGHELTWKETAAFRALSARCNYLSQDRAAIAYSAEELCRKLAVPSKRSYAKLKRLVRYLAGQPCLVHHCPFPGRADWIQCLPRH